MNSFVINSLVNSFADNLVDSLVKQRLVGALILVALGVVFWPIIFVASDGDTREVRVAVPEAPLVDLSPLPAPDNAGLRRAPQARAQAQGAEQGPGAMPFDSDPKAPEPLPALPARADTRPQASLEEARETLQAPAIDADGLPIAYSLQVATIGDRERAETLRDKLLEAGYKGYLQRLRRDDRTLYRVLVGPRYQRDDLLPVKEAVDRTWRVESLIIRYLP